MKDRKKFDFKMRKYFPEFDKIGRPNIQLNREFNLGFGPFLDLCKFNLGLFTLLNTYFIIVNKIVFTFQNRSSQFLKYYIYCEFGVMSCLLS